MTLQGPWLCLNWGKASNKKTRRAGLQAVKDQLWRESGLPGFAPLPSRELVGTLKVAFSLGEQTKPATRSSFDLPWGARKGGEEHAMLGISLKALHEGGQGEISMEQPSPGFGRTLRLSSRCLLPSGRQKVCFKTSTIFFCYPFYHLFAMGIEKAVVRSSFWGGVHPWWALSLWLHREWFTPHGEEGLLPGPLW